MNSDTKKGSLYKCTKTFQVFTSPIAERVRWISVCTIRAWTCNFNIKTLEINTGDVIVITDMHVACQEKALNHEALNTYCYQILYKGKISWIVYTPTINNRFESFLNDFELVS